MRKRSVLVTCEGACWRARKTLCEHFIYMRDVQELHLCYALHQGRTFIDHP